MVLLIVLGVAVVMIAGERLKTGRSWPVVSGWWGRAALLNGFQAGIAFVATTTWDPWMADHRPWNADGLGVVGGAVAGYFAITFVYYWWHRARHHSAFLWRVFHQVHHSPQRIEVITSFYKHPLEILANGLLSSGIAYFLVGLGVEATVYAVLLTGLAELFYHWNVPTPHWLGYLIQRPESHCLHHQEGVHAYNYGDLPIYDMVFGTFRNPRRWDARCGFGEGEHALVPMLALRDLHAGTGAVEDDPC